MMLYHGIIVLFDVAIAIWNEEADYALERTHSPPGEIA
jgi:hypothetical protein